ncbi:MAG: hypothetical protein WB507_06015 [Solirubrobacterales bacterium]
MRSRSLPFLCASLAALALLALPATALGAANHPFIEAITGVGTPSGSFEDACGVALHGGSVYVSDYHHDAVDVLGSTTIVGEDPGDGPCGLAVDSEGNLYVDNYRGDVLRYGPAELSAGSGTVIDSGPATGIAVDPATGDLYVDDGTYVAQYKAPVHAGETPVKIGAGGSLKEGYGVAVSDYSATRGYVYVAEAANEQVKVYDPALSTETPQVVIDGAATPQSDFRYLGESELALDSADGHLFVTDDIGHGLSQHPEAVVDEFNAAGSYRGQIAAGITDAEPSGIAIEESSGDVYLTSGNSEGAAVLVYGPTAPAHTLTVTKAGSGGGTITSLPAGIDCGEACSAEYDEEQSITLFPAPDAHSVFVGWTVSGSNTCPGGEGSCSVLLDQNVEVRADFEEPTQRTLGVSVAGSGEVSSNPAGIDCGAGDAGTCSEHFNEGRLLTLTATPTLHNRLHAWSGCDSLPSPTECKVTMSEAKSVHAEFESIPQETLSVAASGEGTVTSEPAEIECTAGKGACSGHFDEGSTVTLTAAAPHAELITWNGCSAQPTQTHCEVTMSEAESVSASFAPVHHSLTVTVAGEGSVSADHGAISKCTAAGGGCTGPYGEDDELTLTATPAAGSAFAGWSGGCEGTGPCALSLTADIAVTANFAPITMPTVEEAPPAQLTLGKLTAKGAVAILQLSVSGPGRVSGSGRDLKRASAAPAAAGPLVLRLALSDAGRRALRMAKHRKLKLKVTLAFTPADGAPAVLAAETLTFKASARRR